MVSALLGKYRPAGERTSMAFKDMREFLAKLDEMGQLKRIKAPINAAQGTNELQTLMRLLA